MKNVIITILCSESMVLYYRFGTLMKMKNGNAQLAGR